MLEAVMTVAFLNTLPGVPVEEARNPYRVYHEVIAAKRVSDLSVNAFVDAENAFSAFLKKRRVLPERIEDIFPAYGFIPPVPEGMKWSYAASADGTGRYFCLNGKAPDLFVKSFARTKRMFEGHDVFFSNDCGANSDTISGNVRPGAQIALTYWIVYETADEIVLPVEMNCPNRKEWFCKKNQHVREKLKNKVKGKPEKPGKPGKPEKS